MMRSSRGFTLIELMIVVAIVAILASIAITVYYASIAKSQLTEAITIADSMKTAVADYNHQTGGCPSSGVGGLLSPASYSGRFVEKADVSMVGGNCVITATMRSNSVAAPIQGKTLSLTMYPGNGTEKWECTSNARAMFLPKTCQ